MSSVSKCQPEIHRSVSRIEPPRTCSETFFIQSQMSGHLIGGGPYLASSCVEPQRGQVRIKDHVTGLNVDGRLPLPYGAQVPG